MKKYSIIILISSLALLALGLIMVLSASSAYSYSKFDNIFHLFNSHLLKALLGLFSLIVFSIIPYQKLKDYSKWAMIIMAGLLVVTLFVSHPMKGAGRWLNLGFFSFQPSDAAKIVLFVHLAALIERKGEDIKDLQKGYLTAFFWILLISGLILIQPNISNGTLLILMGLSILYVGGAQLKHILSSVVFCLFAGGAVAMLFPHSRSRILGFTNSLQNGGDINIQVKQALYGFGSGGLFGMGFGNSRQSDLFLPESYGDFIFSILGEEVGFVGAVIVLLVYLTIFISGIIIAKNTKDKYGQLLAFAISFSIVIYAFVNVAVTTGLFPTTGLPLPFISYGGTSIAFVCMAVGILINIGLSNAKLNSEAAKMKVKTA
jgi:cell division protein FtsW